MTARQAQGTGGAVLAGPLTNGNVASKDRQSVFSWEDWFSHATPQQRAVALGLAQQQGLVYPHQLPATTNGIHPASAKDTELSLLLSRLISGKADPLPRPDPQPLTFFDADLDELQRLAVTRGLGTPDLFLLQGLPGSGKSRVLAELIRQAAALGRRVLFVATHPASLDVVLERLVGKPEVFALRLLDAAEKVEALPAWLRGFTLEEQKQSFLERTLAGARANHEQALSACRQRTDLEPCWGELSDCAAQLSELSQHRQALDATAPGLREAVECEAGDPATSFGAGLNETLRPRHESVQSLAVELMQFTEQLRALDAKFGELASRIAKLDPAYRAKKAGRFWTLAYWSDGGVVPQMDAAQQEKASLDAERHALGNRVDSLTAQRAALEQQIVDDRRSAIESEHAARLQTLTQEQGKLSDEQDRLETQWTALCRRLDVSPTARTAKAIAAARQGWLDAKQLVEQQCQFAQQWTNFVEQTGPQLAARLPSLANVVAVPLSRWQADVKLREAVGTPLDLLIAEDADSLTETDLLKLSRHVKTAVLTACALAEPMAAPAPVEKPARNGIAAPLAAGSCWNRLWQTLEGDSARRPHSWRRVEGRLICELLPVSREDEPHLESERLADAADFELRILHRPRTRPSLAQVVFPACSSFAEAFLFMVREVQEFPLVPLGRTAWWSADADRCCWHVGVAGADAPRLELEPGLSLRIGPDEKIAAIEFVKQAGWDRARAEDWLQRHRQPTSSERTVFLQTPHRYEHCLAHFVQSMVRPGDWLANGAANANGQTALDFTAIPAPARADWPREPGGLELDLSAARVADRLPVGLRPGLPARGVVNYLEAQALVRRLEAWAKDSPASATRVGVLALHAGQVELLRRLIEQSEVLRSRSFPLEVALPSRLHQRECDVVFLSLTRSHPHRCVAFGDDPRELPLAFTRARARLFVFGDPGALSKRVTWQGPLEHLDVNASHQEQVRLSRLLTHLQQLVHRGASVSSA